MSDAALPIACRAPSMSMGMDWSWDEHCGTEAPRRNEHLLRVDHTFDCHSPMRGPFDLGPIGNESSRRALRDHVGAELAHGRGRGVRDRTFFPA